MKNIYTKVYSIKEADDLGHFIVRDMGYEGVQNDSYRYCRQSMEWAFRENKEKGIYHIYIGVNTYNLVVGKNARDMHNQGCSKFIENVNNFKSSVTNFRQEFKKRLEDMHKANGLQRCPHCGQVYTIGNH